MSAKQQPRSESHRLKALWEKLSRRKEFTAADLVAMGVMKSTANYYLSILETNGRVRLIRVDGASTKVFAPADRELPAPELPPGTVPSPEGNMWRSMRILQQFAPTDLATHSSAGGIEIDPKDAATYCRALLAIDYLKVRQTAVPGKREAIYQLVEDTGPHAPRIARVRGVIDPNTNEFKASDTRVRA